MDEARRCDRVSSADTLSSELCMLLTCELTIRHRRLANKAPKMCWVIAVIRPQAGHAAYLDKCICRPCSLDVSMALLKEGGEEVDLGLSFAVHQGGPLQHGSGSWHVLGRLQVAHIPLPVLCDAIVSRQSCAGCELTGLFRGDAQCFNESTRSCTAQALARANSTCLHLEGGPVKLVKL